MLLLNFTGKILVSNNEENLKISFIELVAVEKYSIGVKVRMKAAFFPGFEQLLKNEKEETLLHCV